MERRCKHLHWKAFLVTTPALLWFAMLLVAMRLSSAEPLRVGYYDLSCPSAERIIRQAMERGMQQDQGIAAGVLRLHFHDCFVEVITWSSSRKSCYCYFKFWTTLSSLWDMIMVLCRDVMDQCSLTTQTRKKHPRPISVCEDLRS